MPVSSDEGVADLSQTLELLDGDQVSLNKLISIFLEEVTKTCTQLEQAAGRGDAKTMGSVAHSVKSSAGVFGATLAAAAAMKVEVAGRHGETAIAIAGVPDLVAELGRLSDYLRRTRQ